MLPPVIAAAAARGGAASAYADAAAHLATTHDSRHLQSQARLYTCLLSRVLQGEGMGSALDAAQLSKFVYAGTNDMQVVHQKYGPACYIDSSLPVLAHFCSKCAAAPTCWALGSMPAAHALQCLSCT